MESHILIEMRPTEESEEPSECFKWDMEHEEPLPIGADEVSSWTGETLTVTREGDDKFRIAFPPLLLWYEVKTATQVAVRTMLIDNRPAPQGVALTKTDEVAQARLDYISPHAPAIVLECARRWNA